MKRLLISCLAIMLLVGNLSSAWAAKMPDWLPTGGISTSQNVLSNIRYGDNNTRLRIVLDLSAAANYSVSRENNDTRLVVNLNNIATTLQGAPALRSNAVKDIILGTYGSDTVQLIVDMKAPMEAKVYTMANPHRLVIDIQKEYEEMQPRQIMPGLNYTRYLRVDNRGMLTAYVLEADRSKFDLQLVLAGDSIASGRQKLKAIASAHQAVAAINGGYFVLDGSLIGNTRINGQTAGTTYFDRTSLGFMPDGTLKLATSQYYGVVEIAGQKAYLSGVNCPRGENNTILYNSLFGNYTGTNEFGKEYVVQNGKVIAINQANSFIPTDAQVISVHGTAQDAFAKVRIGDKISIGENFGPELDSASTIVGAGPELLRNGQLHVTAVQEQFPSDIAKGRAPRTALGIKADGKIILMVIDGRQSHSIGTTLTETAQLLQKFGAVNGFNLDGGGSSEMVLQGQILNSPSDGGERPVGSGLILTRR
ncbi:MAG: phosphodiester glycosidase family protein [Veillonellaceae bacterium]|nr:phosphodiester glycosidase family protein [Veillonellaceae bacterium]